MVNETRTFGVAVLLTLVGLAVMLYGVSLNSGQSLNGMMVAGGAVLVAAVGILTAGIMAVEDGEAEATA